MLNILSVREVTKQYNMGEVVVDALRGVSFDVGDGDFVVMLGPSGSGKSTVLNIIGGIDSPTSGEVLYKGIPVSGMNEKKLTAYRRKSVGFVFQFYNLIPNLTAKENIELASELSPRPIPARELLDKIGMADRAGHYPAKMSGGQQQRVAIARAVAKNPDILLCDEPTGALDLATGIEVLKILKDFNESYKKTVIIITHNSDISRIADKTIYIRDGAVDKITVNESPASPSDIEW